MRITYEWTEREWDQAVRVAARKSTRATPLPGMIYALIGIPLLGAVGDLVSLVRSSGRITLAGSIVPLLLVLFAMTAAALLAVSRLRRRRQRESMGAMPAGSREMVLQEAGWRCGARQPDVDQRTVDLPAPVSDATAEAAPVATIADDAFLAGREEPSEAAATTESELSAPAFIAAVTTAPFPALPLRPWSDLLEARQGSGVIVLVHREGFEAVPATALTPEQAGHLHRLVTRKMRPAV